MVGREVSFEVEKSEPHYRETVLEVKNLTVKNQDHFEVVKNVSFSVHGGEVFAIAGVSGNGQIEIADAIAGVEKAASGSILNGVDITNYSIRKRTLKESLIFRRIGRAGYWSWIYPEENLGLKKLLPRTIFLQRCTG